MEPLVELNANDGEDKDLRALRGGIDRLGVYIGFTYIYIYRVYIVFRALQWF